ncbi:MAG: SusD/RagB family nutrient-binding outer membrane lipoprotein [Chitinophagaceae bacterium]|nr:SusD/RagB family nutrient-binding outer membrane lipoprotein [Chitinophagaceae bacterium]
MKKILQLGLMLVLISTYSCKKKFEDLLTNPNQPVSLPAYLILGKELNDLSGGLGGNAPWDAVHRYNQFFCRNYQYYGDNAYAFNNGPFGVYSNDLKNIQQMELEAANSGAPARNVYSAAAKFLKAYYYYHITSLMGDVPMTQALKGLENINGPAYDTQKDVMLQILKWLDEANDDFAVLKTEVADKNFGQYDLFYKGDLSKWQKLANAFQLRVLVSLSKKSGDTDLKIGQRFTQIMGNSSKYPLFSGMADNFSYKYNNDFNRYPLNPSNFGFDALRLNMAETWVKNLTTLEDPRVFATCEPAYKLIDQNSWSLTDFRAFVGSPNGENQTEMETKAQGGLYSLIGRYRYYRTFAAEEGIIAGYPEMCFNIAEAIHRGWVTGDAEQWYKNGIDAMIKFYGITNGSNTFYFLRSGNPTNIADYKTASYNFNFDTYYNQATVKYETGLAGLNKILLQKYLAFFMNSGWEAFLNQRRTGVPVFSVGAGIGNGGVLPKRWTYPVTEQNVNNSNWKAAVDRQFGGQDVVGGELWMNK